MVALALRSPAAAQGARAPKIKIHWFSMANPLPTKSAARARPKFGGAQTFLMLGLACLAGLGILAGLADLPTLSILTVDALFCGFCASAFKQKSRFLLLLHPPAIWAFSQFNNVPFLDLGDGPGYLESTRSVLSFYTGRDDSDLILELIRTANFKYLYFGIVPNILVPDYLYGAPSDEIY